MKKLTLLFILLLFSFSLAVEAADDSSHPNDYKIARAVRQAVRDAGDDLLNSSLLSTWRDYLKLTAMDLDMPTQPLILIKFDEDVNFRNQLKKIIEWELNWERKETQNFIYYYDWENPIPEVILNVQDAHFQEVTKLFAIEINEKIPYRYDLTAEKSVFHPLQDLRGGVVSPHPFDLDKTTEIILSFVNPEVPCITQPLSKLYGDYLKNPATAKAYYDKCLEQIKTHGYYSMADLYKKNSEITEGTPEWFSAYAFVYLLAQNYEPQQFTRFLKSIEADMPNSEFISSFQKAFGETLTELELNSEFHQYTKKL